MRHLTLSRTIRERVLRFGSASSGATAVEFALVSVPFLGLLCGILQWGFIIWAQINLDTVVENATRNLFTGSFQSANPGVTDSATALTKLKSTLCGSGAAATPTVFTCSSVKLNVSPSSSFNSGSYANPYNSSTKSIDSNFENYTCAKPRQIVVVTAAVSVPVFFGKLVPGLTGMADGSYLLRSTNVFRTEPYATSANGGC